MSFGLKSAKATYQRTTIILLHHLVNEEAEVYMGDMTTKLSKGMRILHLFGNSSRNLENTAYIQSHKSVHVESP